MVNLKINWNHVLNHGLALAGTLGVLGAIFVIANKYFGVLSYNGQSSAHLADVISKLTDENNYTIISSVQGHSIWGKDYIRGILMSKAGILYYYRFSYQDGVPVEISIYPELFETWRTDGNIFDSAVLL